MLTEALYQEGLAYAEDNFRNENGKFSVTDGQFYDFKTGEGGKIIKAVMTLENRSWKEAVDFLKNFS